MMQTEKIAPLVDTHAHVIHRGLPFLAGSAPAMKLDWTYDDYVAQLDRAGVRFGVIAAATFLGAHHDYTVEALAHHTRLRATVIVDPGIDPGQLRALDAAGVTGIRIGTGNMESPPDLTSPEYQQLFRRLEQMNWHVHFYGRRTHLPLVLSALERSGVRIVVDHFGARDNQSGPGSDSFAALITSIRQGRTWVKLSGPYLSEGLDHRDLAARFLAEAGAERLLWGSDWPFVKLSGELDYAQTLNWLSDWIPDAAVRHQIDRNALDLYRLPREVTAGQ